MSTINDAATCNEKSNLRDGNLDTFACTKQEEEPILTFNLGATSIITSVIINNRINAGDDLRYRTADRLNNAKITAKLGSDTVKECGTVTTTTDYTIAGQTYKINCGAVADKVVILEFKSV